MTTIRNVFATMERLWSNKKFKVSCLASCIICLAAHAFSYFNVSFIQDRQAYFSEPIFNSAQRAKWFAQYVDLLTWYAYLPWLFGILVIIFLAISVYIIVDVLQVEKSLSIWLIAGLCAVNSSFLCAHIYWPHEIIASLPLACLSVWIWNNDKYKLLLRVVLEAIFISLSLATYGAYTSVGPTLVILALMLELFRGKKARYVFNRGIEYVSSFVGGLVLYYIVLRLFLKFQNIPLYHYMGEERLMSVASVKDILDFIIIAYERSWEIFSGKYIGGLLGLWTKTMLVLGLLIFVILVYAFRKNLKDKSKFAMLVFLLAMFLYLRD